MKVVGTFVEARAASWGTTALVPTMGFLHEGHLALVEAARNSADTVVVSNFVNPLQFGEAADLEAYPRDLDRDNELCRLSGVDVVFAPSFEEMYPVPPTTTIDPGPPAAGMEGAHRPGHFEGVAAAVAKLLGGLRPDRAHFGRKDAQQLAVVRSLVRDLSLPVEIVPGATVREADGLALSSRNVRLSDRGPALALSAGLFAAADLAERGERSGARLVDAVTAAVPDAEYIALVDEQTMEERTEVQGVCVLATAARLGGVRPIDNVVLSESGARVVADRGVRLPGPSIIHR
jgi:pantoate--beta-alanine ligase